MFFKNNKIKKINFFWTTFYNLILILFYCQGDSDDVRWGVTILWGDSSGFLDRVNLRDKILKGLAKSKRLEIAARGSHSRNVFSKKWRVFEVSKWWMVKQHTLQKVILLSVWFSRTQA